MTTEDSEFARIQMEIRIRGWDRPCQDIEKTKQEFLQQSQHATSPEMKSQPSLA